MAASHYTQEILHLWQGIQRAVSLWGYAAESKQGEILTEHLIEHNLTIVNIDNKVHTFKTTDSQGRVVAQGFPDHTLANPLAHSKIRNWHVSDVHSYSDHKYICFDFEITPEHTERCRFNTTRGNLLSFTHIIKTQKPLLKQHLNNVSNTSDINYLDESPQIFA